MKQAGYKKYYLRNAGAFTLVETVTALMILGLMTSSVLVIIDRCVASATDSGLKMRAFEVARANMEELLTSDSLEEMIEYGESEKYPGVTWQTTVETFYEPITSRMWIRGVCKAEYEDSNGEKQTIELMHWLTDVSKEQLLKMAQQDQADGSEQLLESLEEAAEYAGVDVETIEKWVNDGMAVTEEGQFVKDNLDLYKQTEGAPSDEQRAAQVKSQADLKMKNAGNQQQGQAQENKYSSEEEYLNAVDPTTGLTNREVEQMSFMELFELMMKKQKK